ncbi:hypothetical protein GCM10027591_07760 [Zhihengliuella somnathii]
MTELLDFINAPADKSFDLLKVAIVHHRFVWIHPFGNGNGRVGRLLTNALMVKAGFTANTVSAGWVTATDARAFGVIVSNGDVKAAQLSHVYPGSPAAPGKRSYKLMLSRGPLAPFVIRQLDELGLLPSILRENYGA